METKTFVKAGIADGNAITGIRGSFFPLSPCTNLPYFARETCGYDLQNVGDAILTENGIPLAFKRTKSIVLKTLLNRDFEVQ